MSEPLSDFNYEIRYYLVELNGKTDALSRRADSKLEGGEMPLITIFKPDQLVYFEQLHKGQLIMDRKMMALRGVDKDMPEQSWADDLVTVGKLDDT